MEISRDSECNEPQVVQGFPEDRQGHSRNHVEEGCAIEPDKRKDRTFHDDVYYTPRSTARVGALIWSHPGDWITSVGPGRTPTVHWGRYDGRPWVAQPHEHAHRSQTQVLNTGGAHKSLVAE